MGVYLKPEMICFKGHSEPAHHPLDACYSSIVSEPQLN